MTALESTRSLQVRVLLAASLAVFAPRTGHATPQLATDDPPPADIVLFPSDAPPELAQPTPPRSPPPAREILLANRFTATPSFGMIWLEVNGEGGSGMAIQPVLTRSYDRVELQAALMLADWRAGSSMQVPRGGLFERLGGSAGYQAGRIRVERTMTLDLVVEAGAGVQRLERDEGGSITRTDLSLGIGLRMLTDVNDGASSGRSRIFLGMEAAIRVLLMPRADARPDRALVVVMGIPLGR